MAELALRDPLGKNWGQIVSAIYDVTGDTVAADIEGEITRTRDEWNKEIAAIFEPANSVYSGHMPELVTSDDEIRRLYLMGIMGTVYFRRDNPYSAIGRGYDTLMPRYWQGTTFIWDYHLSSTVHAMLDPKVMKKYMNLWMKTDIHTHFGTECMNGGTAGPWYSVNDFASQTWNSLCTQ